MVDGTNPEVPLYKENPFDATSEFGNYLNLGIEYFSKHKDVLFLIFVGGSRTGDEPNLISALTFKVITILYHIVLHLDGGLDM